MPTTVGVLALQGAFLEHQVLLQKAAAHLEKEADGTRSKDTFRFPEVRNVQELQKCDALVIPGGESTTMSLVAAQSNLLEPLREFVKVQRRPVWGTCAGLIMLAEAANSTKRGGQELIGGLDVRVNRNHFGRQIESFVADLDLPFLKADESDSIQAFPGVFIRAPIVEKILSHQDGIQQEEQQRPDSVVAPSKRAQDERAQRAMSDEVEVMGVLPGRLTRAAEKGAEVTAQDEAGDVIAVRQGNVFGTSFHPELTDDDRIHRWWLRQVSEATRQ